MRTNIFLLLAFLSLYACQKEIKISNEDPHIKNTQVASALSKNSSNALELSNYSFLGQDDFNGVTLDTTIWNYRAENTLRGFASILRSNVSLSGDGILRLEAKRSGDTFSASQVSTENTFLLKYGYFECRAKVNTTVGPHCSFWLQSPTYGATNNPSIDGVEIDIFEYHQAFGFDNLYHNLHWNGYGASHQTLGVQETIPGISNGFHVFGLEWTPREYIVYVDGIEKARTSTAVSHRSEFIILSMEITGYGGNRYAGIYPDIFEVDYVKVYQRKPEVTLYQDCEYGGWVSQGLDIGSYTTSQLESMGIFNDDASSIEVSPGLKVTLFSNDNFTGTSITITSDKICLVNDNFNDLVSSLIVSLN